MAKITESIKGYDTMTPEEKLAALEALEAPEVNTDANKLKTQLSKANSEAAELKRKLAEKMTEQEKKDAEAAEAQKKIMEELEGLRKDKAIAGYKASYLSMGYDEKLAEETAKALADGDMTKVFANQKAYQESHDKAVLSGAIKTTPTPPAGTPGAATVTAEQFAAMDYDARVKLFNEQPEVYKELAAKE